MKYFNIFLFLILSVFVNCTMISRDRDDLSKIQGSWVSEEDNNWKLAFSGNKVLDTYGMEESEECIFSISKESCDTTYSSLELTYMKYLCEDDMWCFEIYGITDTVLSYRETSTGRLNVFKKIK